MAIDTVLCNLALGHLGIGKEVADAETENSQEARSCRRFYNTALDAVLEDFDWPFATKYATLNLVEEQPNDEWRYSYRYPADCVQIRKLLSGIRNDTRQSREAYTLGQDANGRLIYTDLQNAKVKYSIRDEDSANYSSAFKIAFSYRLAFYICPTLTTGDFQAMQTNIMNMYRLELANARANAANEEQPDDLPDSEFTRARNDGFDDKSWRTR